MITNEVSVNIYAILKLILIILSRGGAVVARRAHNPKVTGSNPVPATNLMF